jgi:phosphatidylinositol glycan class V
VGFLRYWKVAQLPNFAIASPILVLSVYGLVKYGSHLYETPNQATLDRQRRLGYNDMAFWRNKEILPFFLIHLITTWLVLFASHTQIALRISIANPVIYWTAASLVGSSEADQAKWGRRWLRWTAIWGCISIVLWSGFYPPA